MQYLLKTYRHSFLKVIPVFAGYDSTISSLSTMETHFLKKNTPVAKIRLLKTCYVKSWLIPRGEKPFTLKNYYFENKSTFSKRAFLKSPGWSSPIPT